MKILQIGDGFIGSKTAKRLAEMGHEVDVADITIDPEKHDIRNREAMMELVKGYDVVLLIAAIANLNDFEKNPTLGMDVNVGGVVNVANACMLHHAHLVYISTCCVYGNTPDLPSDEEARTCPSEVYAAAKLAGEWVIKGYAKSYDLSYTILRIATTYGPGMRAALAPAVFINQVKKNEPITIHGNGEQTRTLTYIDDEVEGIALLTSLKIDGETFNISTEEEISVNEMAKIIREELHAPDHPISHIPDRKGQTFTEQIDADKARDIRIWKGRYAPTAHKATTETGWEAQVSFREGIKRTIRWMEDNNMEEIK